MSAKVFEEGGALSAQLLVKCGHEESTLHGNQKQQRQLLFGTSKCKPLWLFGALCMLLAAVSFGALALSILALQNSADLAEQYGSKAILSQIEEMMENENLEDMGSFPNGEDHDQRRSADGGLCSSSNETGMKPLAHITSSAGRSTPIPNDGKYIILTKDWACRATATDRAGDGPQAMVQGGIAFNQSSGFLEFPKAGVYFVYHQVLFRLGRGAHNRRIAKIQLVVCSQNSVRDCSSVITTDPSNHSHLRAELQISRGAGATSFQGGLVRLAAGSKVAVLVWNERNKNQALHPIYYDNRKFNSFMGAYLVDDEM